MLKTIAAHSKNLHILQGLVQEMVSRGYNLRKNGGPTFDTEYICVYSDKQIAYLNHSGGATASEDVYELPSNWDKFLKAADALTRFQLKGYEAEIRDGKVHFGCQSFTKSDLEAVHRLTAEPIGAIIYIGDTQVTARDVVGLISALEKETKSYRGWKVGDTLPKEILRCDDDKPRWFYGYGDGEWSEQVHRPFNTSRTIVSIQTIKGKLAAEISGTSNLWIAIESLPEKK